MTFRIVTDTSANLPKELLEKYDITVIPFSFQFAGEDKPLTETTDFDGARFYTRMRAGEAVSTSQIPPQSYVDCFEPMLARGEEVLYVGMSSGISGAFNSSVIAREQLLEQYPQAKLRLVDALGASLGEGLFVLQAAQHRENGFSLEETARQLEARVPSMCQVFTVGDLKYLRRGGRISNLAAAVGTVLQIKPILKGNELGKIVVTAKVRGRKNAIKTMAEEYRARVDFPSGQTVGIAHADCAQDAEELAAMLRQKAAPAEIITVDYEPVTGSHVGPGALALFFFAGDGARPEAK